MDFLIGDVHRAFSKERMEGKQAQAGNSMRHLRDIRRGVTDGRTDGRMDGRTDGWTDGTVRTNFFFLLISQKLLEISR